MSDRLFSNRKPDAGDKDFLQRPTFDNQRVLNAFVDVSLANAKPNDKVQLERNGYFVVDRKDHTAAKPMFNLAVTLEDSWGK